MLTFLAFAVRLTFAKHIPKECNKANLHLARFSNVRRKRPDGVLGKHYHVPFTAIPDSFNTWPVGENFLTPVALRPT